MVDANDAYDAYKRVGSRGNRYMDGNLQRRFSEQQAGNPFEFPETPDELEMMVGWFFDRLRVIVSIENHSLKFDGVRQIIDILHDAGELERVNVKFAWVNGQWFIPEFGNEQDILNLPKLLRRFSRIYRHHASDYSYGDDEKIQYFEKRGDKYLHLTTTEEYELRRRQEEGL